MTDLARPTPDRSLAILKGVALLLVMLPGLVMLADLARDALGAKPITEIIHRSGDWSIRLLFVSLLITPLRQTLKAHKLASVRRIVGVAAFAYIVIHVAGYVVDEKFDLAKVASEIVLRVYLTIGFVGVVLLGLLAATSTDAMTRRLGGKRWKKLHRASYLIGVIAVAHFFMQSKLDVSEPTVMGGLFIWLMLWRAWAEWIGRDSATSLWGLTLLAAVAGLATAGGEWVYYAAFTAIDPSLVLQANLAMLRPAWIVLMIALTVPLAAALWRPLARVAKTRAAA